MWSYYGTCFRELMREGPLRSCSSYETGDRTKKVGLFVVSEGQVRVAAVDYVLSPTDLGQNLEAGVLVSSRPVFIQCAVSINVLAFRLSHLDILGSPACVPASVFFPCPFNPCLCLRCWGPATGQPAVLTTPSLLIRQAIPPMSHHRHS